MVVNRFLVDGLNAIGLETFEPRGAFYAFPRIGSTGLIACPTVKGGSHAFAGPAVRRRTRLHAQRPDR